MSYINVGARDRLTNAHVPTKKALKASLAQDPGSVVFYGTSPFTPFSGTVEALTPGTVLTVCGPDPERKRNWWANVTIDSSGKVKVS